jgi:hypothetical protein
MKGFIKRYYGEDTVNGKGLESMLEAYRKEVINEIERKNECKIDVESCAIVYSSDHDEFDSGYVSNLLWGLDMSWIG